MVQAIKDLANAFVPSGRLIELVDITLVRAPPPLPLSLCFTVLKVFRTLLSAAADGRHAPTAFW